MAKLRVSMAMHRSAEVGISGSGVGQNLAATPNAQAGRTAVFFSRGRHSCRHVVYPARLLLDYPLREVVQYAGAFVDSVAAMYAKEKRETSGPAADGRIDLRTRRDLHRMDFHVKVHAVTGLPHWGTSTTTSIPYWDRQAVIQALKHQFPRTYPHRTETADAETVNLLRAMIGILAPEYRNASAAVQRLMAKVAGPQETHRNLHTEFHERLHRWQAQATEFRTVLIAKAKHLIFALDKTNHQGARTLVAEELEYAFSFAGVSLNSLTIDLGLDGGLTAASQRPPYVISNFVQLRHLHRQTVAIPSGTRLKWTARVWKRSLERPSGCRSYLQEPTCLELPWRFD